MIITFLGYVALTYIFLLFVCLYAKSLSEFPPSVLNAHKLKTSEDFEELSKILKDKEKEEVRLKAIKYGFITNKKHK